MTFSQLISVVNLYKTSVYSLGTALREAKPKWNELVGEGVSNWSDFLSQPEIGLTAREATSLIEIANMVERINLPITNLNLANVKFCASRGISTDDIKDDMQELSLKDFKERYYDVEVAKTDNAPRSFTYMMMKRCNETGTLSRVYDEVELKENLSKTDNG